MLSGPHHIPPGTTHLLVVLHGFGADGNDLMPLHTPLQAALGQAGVILGLACPHAPAAASMAEGGLSQGRQWFSPAGWAFRDEPGLHSLVPQLNAYLQTLLETHRLKPAHLTLMGFSQGSMALLGALPWLNPQPARCISLSGGLTMPPKPEAIAAQAARPPILFVHGLDDDVWPADHTVAAAQFYRQHGYPTQQELLANLGHGISAEVLAHITLALTAS